MTRLRSLLRAVHAFTADRRDLLASVDARDDLIENLQCALALAEQERDEARSDAELANAALERQLIRDWSDDLP